MATPRKRKAQKSKTSTATTKKRKPKAAKSTRRIAAAENMAVLKPEFVEDLKKVFEKHNWTGHPLGFVASPAMADLGFEPCDPGPVSCPPGQTLQTQWARCPDGSIILRRFCA